MAALKQTLHDEGYEEAAEACTYTVAVTQSDWDLFSSMSTWLIRSLHGVLSRSLYGMLSIEFLQLLSPQQFLLLLMRSIPSRSLRVTRSRWSGKLRVTGVLNRSITLMVSLTVRKNRIPSSS